MEAVAGLAIEGAELAAEGKDLRVPTGPAAGYWNPANTASGGYTVKATFTESTFMALNSQPHLSRRRVNSGRRMACQASELCTTPRRS